MKKRFGEEQIVAILGEGQAGQKTAEQLCREHGISQATYYGWKRKYGSMNEPDVKRLRELEKENARLKRLLAPLLGIRTIAPEAPRGNLTEILEKSSQYF